MKQIFEFVLLLAAITATALAGIVIVSEFSKPNNNVQYEAQIAQAQAREAQSNAMEAQAQAARADAQADMAEVVDDTLAMIFLGVSNWIALIVLGILVFVLLGSLLQRKM